MQYNFNCEQILGCDPAGFAVLEGSFPIGVKPGYMPYVNEILDSIGFQSSKAQGLNTVITSGQKFFSSNHRIFIKAESNKVIGFIKVGVKKLYVRDEYSNYIEISPLCVLDFYVHETMQRGGEGKSLFENMLKSENVEPVSLAYDRPSAKLLSFLKKHYRLCNFLRQNNNFVVFNEYFEKIRGEDGKKRLQNGSHNIQTKTNNYSSNKTNLALVGQNLMSGDRLPSEEATPSKLVSRGNFNSPNQVFSSVYMNDPNTNYYDNIYSKKKLKLLNDYINNNHGERDNYIKDQLNIREKENQSAFDRVNQLENSVNTNNNNFYNFVKRNEFSTLFDDKKVLERRQKPISPTYQNNNIIGINSISNINGLKAEVLPTTSSAYGAYYYTTDYKNRIYY